MLNREDQYILGKLMSKVVMKESLQTSYENVVKGFQIIYKRAVSNDMKILRKGSNKLTKVLFEMSYVKAVKVL